MGAENPRRIVENKPAMLRCRRWNRSRPAGAGSSCLVVAGHSQQLTGQPKEEANSFLITHPTRFEKAPGRGQGALELVPHPNRAKAVCQVRILENSFVRFLFLLLAKSTRSVRPIVYLRRYWVC